MPIVPQSAPPTFLNRQPASASALCAPVLATLQELAGVVESLTPEQFIQPCGESFANGSIGSHVRHCLDHVRALTEASDGCVDYDRRIRGTEIERDPAAALRELRRLQANLGSLNHQSSTEPVRVRVILTRDGEAVDVRSTLGRELAFVLSHTIHHNALVRGMAGVLGAPLPPTFGYAPATLSHRDNELCAR